MSYLIKLYPDNCYLISDGEGDMITTDSRQEAIKNGLFDDFGSADDTAQCFSGGMTRGVDYIIESVSLDPYHVVQITIPTEIAPKLKDIDRVIRNDKALVLLTNTTTSRDAENGITKYGISTGTNAVLLKTIHFEKARIGIENYLNERFGNQWELQLIPINA
ncbi:hypothetical protein [Acinetobacter sp. MB5]|uniref:hypothetical protein n=1 Tax=Acinetobacter sp. MB5 TaxID=2069438 RepID=UPI000DD08E25|nr:hypothetical protein [Acinetobacter sp. MB5]